LENNKTFGRTENKKRLLYKCVPDDSRLPPFLVPYDIKIGFSKVQKNKYVVFRFDHWNGKHPHGLLTEVLGDVDSLDVFYEYQLYCKSLYTSMTEFTKTTRAKLSEKTNADYVDQILKNPNFLVQDFRDKYVFTIDPPNSVDYDDGFSIEAFDYGFCITIYIANVFLWLETLGLWDSFSKRVSTIYLPDRRRPMLPTILSDSLCSLQENQPRFAVAMQIHVDVDGNLIPGLPVSYKNVLVSVSKNYSYEERSLVSNDKYYKQLFDISYKMDQSIKNSHDLVSYWMILMNSSTGIKMANAEIGIFRTASLINNSVHAIDNKRCSDETIRVIHNWNNTIGQYVIFDKDMFSRGIGIKSLTPKSYIHITSPIRRLVDLLNQMILLTDFGIIKTKSETACRFLKNWTDQMEYINTTMRSIRKIQTDCEVLNRCYSNPHIMDKQYEGVVFDKVTKEDGTFNYMVYLEELKLLSRITTFIDLENYASHLFRMYLFEDEDKVKRKIRLQACGIDHNTIINK
jgi:exoribonuclease R